MKGQIFESPRGQMLIDAQTRDIVQDIYIRKVEKKDGQLYNVEFDVHEGGEGSGQDEVTPAGRAPALRPRLEDEVERRLGGAAEAGEAASRRRPRAAAPRRPGRRAPGRPPATASAGVQIIVEARVEDAADRVEVVLDAVVGERLDDHPGAVGGQRLAHVRGGADRVAHVVQAVEEGDQVVAAARVVLGARPPRS